MRLVDAAMFSHRPIAEILQEAAGDPSIARTAPHTVPVRRLDEVRAARELTVTQRW